MPPTWNKVSDSTDAWFIRYKLQFECAVTIALITCRSSLFSFSQMSDTSVRPV